MTSYDQSASSAVEMKYGKRLLPQVVDQIARETPEREYGRYPKPNWRCDGYQPLSFGQLSRASNKLAFWLDHKLGKCVNFQTVGFIGNCDLTYAFAILATVKTSRQLLVADGRLNKEGLSRLIDSTKCEIFLATATKISGLTGLLSDRPDVKILECLPFEYWLEDATSTEHYQYNKTWEEAKDDPLLIFHSSGTTGLPKPFVWRNSSIGIGDILVNTKALEGEESSISLLTNRKLLVLMPLAWAAAVFMYTTMAIFGNTVFYILPDDVSQPLTATDMSQIHQVVDVDAGCYVPSALRDISKKPEAFDIMTQKLKVIAYAGAPLEKWCGDMFSQKSQVVSLIGSTEGGLYATILPDNPTHWHLIRFHELMGAQFDHVQDDLYELSIVRRPGLEATQLVFITLPHLTIFNTKDLFRRREDIGTDIFEYHGRNDDLNKLSWLAKFRAADIEVALERLPCILSALVGGDGKEVPFVLIEPSPMANIPPAGHNTTLEPEIWSAVEQINLKTTNEICIPRQMIIVTDPARPFQRTSKGTLNRRSVLAMYAADIEDAYSAWRRCRHVNGLES